VRQLRKVGENLKPLTPHLTNTFKVVNSLLNTLAFNPKGAEEGFLFWVSWANHNGATVFATQDAHGPIRRGLIVTSCSSLDLLNRVVQANPALNTLFTLLNTPVISKICPSPIPGAPATKQKGKAAPGAAAKPAPGNDPKQASPTPGKPAPAQPKQPQTGSQPQTAAPAPQADAAAPTATGGEG
jgi:hypothetical protein